MSLAKENEKCGRRHCKNLTRVFETSSSTSNVPSTSVSAPPSPSTPGFSLNHNLLLNSPRNSNSPVPLLRPQNQSSRSTPVKRPRDEDLLLSPSSPLKPRWGDRFIPARAGNTWHLTFPSTSSASTPPRASASDMKDRSPGSAVYSCLLKNEVLGYQFDDSQEKKKETPNRKLFHYDSSERSCVVNEAWSPYSLSPISSKSEELLRNRKKPMRKISKVPFKVLDAPELQDDFYLNLVDWSSQNVLSVGLGTCVYLWSASNSQVTKLCDLSDNDDTVTSVAWNEKGNLVAVGTQTGDVQLWDAASTKKVATLQGHSGRVGSIAWNGDLLASGSRDRFINQKDTRTHPAIQERQLVGHRQEVCGLKWSPDHQFLASGGNDNRLYVWNLHSTTPMQNYSEHLAAVKAIAWCPHQHGLLASGGGTADRCIRFWNTLTGQPMQCIDTGSQVCNLAWSKHSTEFVSTHGYSQNQIVVWKYPTLQQITKLTGHSYRVLYLAMSPDGEAIVTGAGDETLRFWNVFSKPRSQKENKSSLNLYCSIR